VAGGGGASWATAAPEKTSTAAAATHADARAAPGALRSRRSNGLRPRGAMTAKLPLPRRDRYLPGRYNGALSISMAIRPALKRDARRGAGDHCADPREVRLHR